MKTEKDYYVVLPNNPLVPPKGDVCFIKRLPAELLSRVFELGTADDEDINEDEAEDTDDSFNAACAGHQLPLVASSVCRDWRTVACATPSLWTTIVITTASTPPYPREKTLLARSKNLPVDIYINLEFDELEKDEGPSDADLALLFSILIGHIRRWRTMEVLAKAWYMARFLEAVSESSIPIVPRLKALKLCCSEGADLEETSISPLITECHHALFGLAPSLTTIILSGVHVDWDQPWIASNSKLTDLRLIRHSYDVRPTGPQFATMLRGASSLKRLTLDRSGSTGWSDELPSGSSKPISLVQLPQLTDLILGSHSVECAIELIRNSHLPALKHLVIDVEGDDFIKFIHELVGPTSTSPMEQRYTNLLTGLQSLTLGALLCEDHHGGYKNAEDGYIERFYRALESLTSLKIAASSRFPGILSMPPQWSLPNLKELYVSGAGGDRIRQVVEAREKLGFPIRTLHVGKGCVEGREDVLWLRKNVKTVEYFDRKRWGVPWMDLTDM